MTVFCHSAGQKQLQPVGNKNKKKLQQLLEVHDQHIQCPLCQESCRLSIPITSPTRGPDGIDRCVLTARPSRLMSAGG